MCLENVECRKVIRVNGTTTLWEVLVSVCDVVTAKTDVIDIDVR